MAGVVFHVVNRGSRRGRLFDSNADYERFERILQAALAKRPIRLLSFCAMPNHFHLIVWPESNHQLPEFMHWLTSTHAIAWRTLNQTLGQGAVYQGRYKAMPIQTEGYFLAAARYVERNALQARLCVRAEEWRWCSLWHRDVARDRFPLAEWPIARPADWVAHVNAPQSLKELAAIRRSVKHGCALGNPSWQDEMARTLRIPGYYRGPGRPSRNGS